MMPSEDDWKALEAQVAKLEGQLRSSLDKITVVTFGRVLAEMSGYAKKRAEHRRAYLGKENAELLWALGHMLQAGAEKCLEIGREDHHG